MAGEPSRLVLLGASNLTRGFQSVVATARNAWGPNIEIVAALGHGRSYGAPSTVFARTLPGILESGLWQQLEQMPTRQTRALVTDIGNDLVYGRSAQQVLAWVEEAITRLERVTSNITLTALPITSIQELGPTKFLLLRSLMFPDSRVSYRDLQNSAARLNEGLASLAARHEINFRQVERQWYSFDSIHIRRSQWRRAWPHILCDSREGSALDHGSFLDGLKLYFMPPERRAFLGWRQITPQEGKQLRTGGRIWLY